jgi:hypothetical protein
MNYHQKIFGSDPADPHPVGLIPAGGITGGVTTIGGFLAGGNSSNFSSSLKIVSIVRKSGVKFKKKFSEKFS